MASLNQHDIGFFRSLLRLIGTVAKSNNCFVIRQNAPQDPFEQYVQHPDFDLDISDVLPKLSLGSVNHDTLIACIAHHDDGQIIALHTRRDQQEKILIVLGKGETLTASLQEKLLDIACIANPALDQKQMTLPDREASRESLSQLIKNIGTQARRARFGVILVAFDQLRQINRHYGWDQADLVLNVFVERVQNILPPGGFLGSVGGGLFILLTPPGTSSVGTRTLTHALQNLTAEPISAGTRSVSFTLSVGWGLYPDDGHTTDDLLVSVGAALADAQQEGGGHEKRAAPERTERHQTSSRLEEDLANAIAEDALSLRWMPIIKVSSQKTVAYEALLRWNRPGIGEVSPALFIRNAEENGLIEQLDRWALRNACKAAVQWEAPHRVCVNVSPVWLVTERLTQLVTQVLQETGLSPRRLQIEISERGAVGPGNIIFRELARVRALGVRLAIDDFGSGTASLERLRTYPLDQLKLDRIFVKQLGEDERVDEVMRGILKLAQSLGLGVCAKGIETERQLSFLDSHGCFEAQGYLFGSPGGDKAQTMVRPIPVLHD